MSALGAEWRDLAACRGMDTEIFFPENGDSAGLALAKGICAGCPVREECFELSVEVAAKHGVWGGLGEGGRRRKRRGLGITLTPLTDTRVHIPSLSLAAQRQRAARAKRRAKEAS